MRKIICALVVIVSAILVAPCFASVPSITDGLVGCWDFDEGSLATAMDMSGNGNDGVMVNVTYSDPAPATGSSASLHFNTTQTGYAHSYVTIPDSPSLRPSSGLTLAAWVKTSTDEVRSCGIITKQYGSSFHDSFALWYQYGNVNFVLQSGTNYRGISTAKSPANEWHYVVGTYNGSSMRLYVDGVERVDDVFTGTISYDGNPVLIGADCDNGNHIPDAGWNGFIDEAVIYNRSLTQAEILQTIPEFPFVLPLTLFMSATAIAVMVYVGRQRKQPNPSFS